MQLSEFLLTPTITGLSDAEALIAAQAVRVGRLISPDMMLAFLNQFYHVDVLDTVLENPSTLVTKEAKALRKGFEFGTEFNLITGHPASILSALNQLKTDGGVGQNFVDYCIYYANDLSDKRFTNVTLHDIKLARNTVTLKPVTQVNGYVVIETNADCEKHNPRLVGSRTNPRTDKVEIQRINNFYGVSEMGKYEAKVPNEWLGADLFVDDVYGVII